ncbi:MAG: DUF1772 domain-containing protein [Agriterribacter sp.]
MTAKFTLFITLLAYSIIVSQSFMYILALKEVQLKMEADQYTQFRQLIDTSMRSNFKYVIYAALIANLLLVIIHIKTPSSITFITAAIAFVALVADVVLTLKCSLPINDVINSWSQGNYPANWQDYRLRWLSIFQYRQILSIIGFVSLLIAAVFGGK